MYKNSYKDMAFDVEEAGMCMYIQTKIFRIEQNLINISIILLIIIIFSNKFTITP